MARASRDPAPPAVPRKLADRRIARPDMPGVALRAVSLGDLRQLMRWLAAPHVAAVRGPPHAALQAIATQMEAPDASPFVIVGAGRPVGFLRIRAATGDPFWRGHDLPRETFGLDLFIGETDALRQGHGSACLALAAAHLLDIPGVARVQGDPAPGNEASLRAFARAGFKSLGVIATPDGPAIHMVVERRSG